MINHLDAAKHHAAAADDDVLEMLDLHQCSKLHLGVGHLKPILQGSPSNPWIPSMHPTIQTRQD